MDCKLSILVPTVKGREQLLKRLISEIEQQAKPYGDAIEFIEYLDNKEISIGNKRHRLLVKANGKYVVFIDDDDWISKNYVAKIMEAIEQDPDCITFQIKVEGMRSGRRANVALKYSGWMERYDGFDFVRTPYHKTPIRKSIALKVDFKDMRFAEDADFSKRLKDSGLLQKEIHIPEQLYIYRFKFEHPRTKYGLDK